LLEADKCWSQSLAGQLLAAHGCRAGGNPRRGMHCSHMLWSWPMHVAFWRSSRSTRAACQAELCNMPGAWCTTQHHTRPPAPLYVSVCQLSSMH
jgi:hypothetical protein